MLVLELNVLPTLTSNLILSFWFRLLLTRIEGMCHLTWLSVCVWGGARARVRTCVNVHTCVNVYVCMCVRKCGVSVSVVLLSKSAQVCKASILPLSCLPSAQNRV